MKMNEFHWENYINNINEVNFHPKLLSIYNILPDDLTTFPNMIIYGPDQTGKYSQALNIINKYSNSKLKYEKKILIENSKEDYFIKMSDVHFEIDFNLLGCNGKQLWNCIYNQILEIINSNPSQQYFILCKNFQNINIETLDIFYSYLQKNFNNYKLIYIIITNSITFIPENILSCFVQIPVSKEEIDSFKIINKKNETLKLNDLVGGLINIYKKKININLKDIRNKLYNLLIFNHNISLFVELMTEELLNNFTITIYQMDKIIVANQQFLYFFENNYRPIFHLESYFYSLLEILNEH